MNTKWEENQKYVLEELRRLSDGQAEANKILNELCINMAVEKSRVRWLVSGISLIVSSTAALIISFIHKIIAKG